ncbi:hypothetical protein [Mesorhizobium sp. 128a]
MPTPVQTMILLMEADGSTQVGHGLSRAGHWRFLVEAVVSLNGCVNGGIHVARVKGLSIAQLWLWVTVDITNRHLCTLCRIRDMGF